MATKTAASESVLCGSGCAAKKLKLYLIAIFVVVALTVVIVDS